MEPPTRGSASVALAMSPVFSLYYSKNLGALGEAGICTTNNADLAEKMRMIRDHGSRVRYQHEVMGVNARLDELQAAVLLVKLPHLEHWNEARQQHAQFYTEQLREFVEAVPVVRPWQRIPIVIMSSRCLGVSTSGSHLSGKGLAPTFIILCPFIGNPRVCATASAACPCP